MVRAKHKSNKTAGRIFAVVLTLLVLVLAALVFLYRDKLSPAQLNPQSEDLADLLSASAPFTYEAGSRQQFALMGDHLAIASSTGLQLLDGDGVTVAREVFSMTNPAVCATKSTCAFYDVGGFTLRAYHKGEFVNLEQENEIISVSVNSSGYYTVAGFKTGYKGSVTVYNPSLSPIYRWDSGNGYLIDAALSPDNRTLAILCAEATGSVVRLFRTDSEEESSSISLPNELAFKLSFEAGGNFCLLSESNFYVYNPAGRQLSSRAFGEDVLVNYILTEELWTLAFSKYVSVSETNLLSFNGSGKEIGALTLADEPLSLSAQGSKLLALSASSLSLYNSDLRLQKQNNVVPGYLSAVLMPKGSVLLLSSHFGEKCEFR